MVPEHIATGPPPLLAYSPSSGQPGCEYPHSNTSLKGESEVSGAGDPPLAPLFDQVPSHPLAQTTYPGHARDRKLEGAPPRLVSPRRASVCYQRPKSPRTEPFRQPIKTGNRVQIKAKNGLPSIDRNNKATLLFTGPCRTTKSYAKDLSPRIVKLQDVS